MKHVVECERLDRHEHPAHVACSRIAHERLGWCAGWCSVHTYAQEAAGWRLLALQELKET